MPSQWPRGSSPPYQDEQGRWRCGAHNKHAGTTVTAENRPIGDRCTRPAPHPPHRCKQHGGSTPQVKEKQARAELEAKVMRLMPDTFEPMANPVDRLLRAATEADTFRSIVLDLVNDLNWKIRYSSDEGSEQLRAEVSLYERAIERLTRVLVDIVKLDLTAQLVRIREREATAMLAALDRGLTDAGLTVEQQAAVKAGTARHLRAVS